MQHNELTAIGASDRARAGHSAISPEVAAVIAAWMPYSADSSDATALAAVMPAVRAMVAAAGPKTPPAARRLLWALAPMAVHLYRSLGVFNAATVNHDNVEIWVSRINAKRKPGWRNTARAALRAIGAAVNPHGWPTRPKPLRRPPAVAAYSPKEEAGYIDAAGLPGCANPEGRRWVVAGGLGAGMNGVELAAARVDDLREMGGGRLAVQVRGRNARLVPIRGCCTVLVREAVRLVEQRPPHASSRFVCASHRNAGARLASKVTIGRGRGLSLPRARSTWLTAHLRAETPPLALIEIARPLSAVTLNDLLATVAVSPEEAAAKGLRA